jgi:hypothetical protein
MPSRAHLLYALRVTTLAAVLGLSAATLMALPPEPLPDISAADEFVPVHVAARGADLEFRYLRPAHFAAGGMADGRLNRCEPSAFVPLHVATGHAGAAHFAVATRLNAPGQTLRHSAELLIAQEELEVLALRPGALGGMPALWMEALQPTESDIQRIRLALIDDGHRVVRVSIVAPVAIWSGAEPALQTALGSFEVVRSRDAAAAVVPSEAPPAGAAVTRSDSAVPGVGVPSAKPIRSSHTAAPPAQSPPSGVRPTARSHVREGGMSGLGAAGVSLRPGGAGAARNLGPIPEWEG